MTYRNITTFAAIVAFVFALGFMFMPARLTSFYNVTLDDSGAFVAQLFGASLLGFGVVNWFGRGLNDGQARDAVINANLIGDAAGFVFALLGQLGGVGGVNALGWSTVILYLLLTAGFAYLRFVAR